jgi:hypothetical protein
MKLPLTFAFVLACMCTAAHAGASEAAPYSPQYYACVKKAGPPGFYDQSAAAACDDAEVKFQKKRLTSSPP